MARARPPAAEEVPALPVVDRGGGVRGRRQHPALPERPQGRRERAAVQRRGREGGRTMGMLRGCGHSKLLTDHTVKARHPCHACLCLSWHDPGERPGAPLLSRAPAAGTLTSSCASQPSSAGSSRRLSAASCCTPGSRAAACGLPPPLIFGHAAAALTGLVIWTAFLASGIRSLAWAAVGLLMAAIGLGLCTVTLWTPYPARRPRAAADIPHEEWPYRRGREAGAGWPAG